MWRLLKPGLVALLVSVLLLALTSVFLGLAGFLQMKSVSVGFVEAEQTASWEPINQALALLASAGVVFLLLFPHERAERGFLDAVHVRPLAGAVVGLCFATGVAMQFGLAELGNLGQEIWPMSFETLAKIHAMLTPKTLGEGLSAVFAFVLVPPVVEELVFRGWLLPMLRKAYGTPAGLALSSLLFGAVHGQPSAILFATIAGVILGAIAIRTKSTLASIAVHAGVNATPLFFPVTLIRIDGFNTLPNDVEHIAPWLVAGSVVVAGGLLMLIWRATEE